MSRLGNGRFALGPGFRRGDGGGFLTGVTGVGFLAKATERGAWARATKSVNSLLIYYFEKASRRATISRADFGCGRQAAL